MKVRRRPEWKQENPRDQVRHLLGSAMVEVHNYDAAVGTSKEAERWIQPFQRIIRALVDCQDILYAMDENEWDPNWVPPSMDEVLKKEKS